MPNTSIYISQTLLDKIDALAKQEGRSRSNFVEHYLGKVVEEKLADDSQQSPVLNQQSREMEK